MTYSKVAIISDLHANLYMLNTFLAYVEREGIELIVNLGDFISEGPYPVEVFNKLLEDKRFINIKGYDEVKILGEKLKEEGVGTLAWTKEKLSTEMLNKLKQLPMVKNIEVGGLKILITHLNGFAEMSQKIAHSKVKVLDGNTYDYIFVGGSHLQQLTHAKEPFFNTNIIEPGALMKDENDRGHFAVLEIKENKPKITFESITCKEVYTSQKQIQIEEIPYLIEEVNLQKDVRLHIYCEGKDSNTIKKEVMEDILELGFRKSKYISIGCWASEQEKIRELLFYLKCRRIEVCERSGQQWYIGEVTQEIIDLVKKEVNHYQVQLKWFEISFLENIYSVKPVYSIYHSGKECLVNRMSEYELENIEKKLKRHKVLYEINA